MIKKPRLEISVLFFFVCILFCLAAVPVVSMGQINSFDTNGNGLIDDEELTVIINYWAQQKLTPPPPINIYMRVFLPGGIPLELVNIPSGEGIVNSQKVHVDEFWMGRFEITQAQWKAVMGTNPSHDSRYPQKPVELVSWNDCHDFLDKLNVLGLGHFSLPSEAQWEYACRAGTKTRFFWGDSDNQAGLYSWYYDNSDWRTQAIGTRAPNPWGLYDMTGNVLEWCEDLYSSNTVDRVLRGGSWVAHTDGLRSSHRLWNTPAFNSYVIGFRVVRTP